MIKKILIFDFDGVLFDSISLSMSAMAESYPGLTKETYRELQCGNIHEEIKKLPLPKKQRTEEEEQHHRLLFAEKKREVPMYPGAKELLQKLHTNGHTLILNTSAYEKNVHPLLEKADIISLFDFIATAETSKSKHDKFKIIEERYSVTGKDFLFITDSIGDVREAELLNIPTIAVTWGVHDRSYFQRLENPKHLIAIVDTIEELQEYLEKI